MRLLDREDGGRTGAVGSPENPVESAADTAPAVSQTWTAVLNSYDAAGRMTEQQVRYADRHVDDMVLDPASQQVLGSTSRNASGHVTQQSVQHPDGTATRTGYDAAGVADEVTTWNADGTSTVLETNTASHPFGAVTW